MQRRLWFSRRAHFDAKAGTSSSIRSIHRSSIRSSLITVDYLHFLLSPVIAPFSSLSSLYSLWTSPPCIDWLFVWSLVHLQFIRQLLACSPPLERVSRSPKTFFLRLFLDFLTVILSHLSSSTRYSTYIIGESVFEPPGPCRVIST